MNMKYSDSALAQAFREFAADYMVKHSRANALCERIESRAAEIYTTPPEQQTQQEAFAEWLRGQMPQGTVIGDPGWWASRILQQVRRLDSHPLQGGRVIGARNDNGVHVIIAKPFWDALPNVELVRYDDYKAIAAKLPADVEEQCESGLPDCGAVEFWDSEGVPLCRRCRNEFAQESGSGN